MYKKIFIVLVLLLSVMVNGQTYLSDTIKVQSIDLKGNPYIIEKELIVPSGRTLKIGAGCILLFKNFAGFTVDGRLEINGEKSNPVILTSYNDSKFNEKAEQVAAAFDWNGIKVTGKTSSAIMNEFSIRYSVYGIKSTTEAVQIKGGLFKENGQYNFMIRDRLQQVQDEQPYSWQPPQDVTMYSSTDAEHNVMALIERLLLKLPLAEMPTVAVMPFDPKETPQGKIGIGVSEYLINVLSEVPSITLVERSHFKQIISETALSGSGVINEESAVKIGKALAAKYIVTGSIVNAVDGYTLNVRMVETETARIVAAGNAQLDKKKLVDFTSDVLGERLKVSSSLFRSVVVPGWGQIYAGKDIRGYCSLGAFVISAGVTTWGFINAAKSNQEYLSFVNIRDTKSGMHQLKVEYTDIGLDTSNTSAFNNWVIQKEHSIQKAYTKNLNKAFIFASIAGGVWALNLLDATIAGIEMKHKTKLYFSYSNSSPSINLAINY